MIENYAVQNTNNGELVQKLEKAEERIKQLEATVDRYKNLLHRLTQIENNNTSNAQQQQQQNNQQNIQQQQMNQNQNRKSAQTPVQQRTQPPVRI